MPTLRGRTVVTLFYESSTRTSSSFELAAKRLSADLVSVKAAGSSVDKGESLKDTVATLSAYDPAAIVIRHPYAGAAQLVAGWTEAAVVNAGDGKHEHPSQALLDVYTLRRRLGSLEGKRIWIVGDVLHSRVARSNLIAFQRDGRRGDRLRPADPDPARDRGARLRGRPLARRGSSEADVVYALRMQHERMSESFVPSIREYAAHFQIDTRRLGPRQLLMHPGPVNRGVELSGEVIDSPQSLIAEQVAAGLVVRMAILYELLAGGERPGARRRGRGRRAPARPRSGSRREPRRGARHAPRRGRRPGPARRHRARPGRRDRRRPRRRHPRRPDRRAGRARRRPTPDGAEVVEAEGLHAFPAFFDPHVHLRTPGQEHKEDIETGHPRRRRRRLLRRSSRWPTPSRRSRPPPTSRRCASRPAPSASVPVGFLATVTRGMEGEELTEMAELRDAGAVGFTDDGLPIRSARVLRRALQYQRLCGGTIALHEEDPELSGDGVMHEGPVSAALGLAGIPSVSESTMIARDAALAGYEDGADPRPAPLRRRVGRGGRAPPRRPGCRSAARPARTTSASPTRRCAASTRAASR